MTYNPNPNSPIKTIPPVDSVSMKPIANFDSQQMLTGDTWLTSAHKVLLGSLPSCETHIEPGGRH